MEDKPLFQFKKAKVTIGGIDVGGPSEWELLVCHDTNDLPKFIHYQKLWNIIETPDEVDQDGNVTKPGIKQSPGSVVYRGFIKDDKFVVTKQVTLMGNSYHEAHMKLKYQLENVIENGYKKDESRYSGEYGMPPQYYANERTPLVMHQSNAGPTPTIQGQTQQVAPQPAPKKSALGNLLKSFGNFQQNP